MNFLRKRRFKATLGLAIAVAAMGIVTAAVAVAGGFGGFDQASSAKGLSGVRGVIYDWANTKDGRDWVISGEWTLDCRKTCANAKLDRIDFDMAFAMVRAGNGVDGSSPGDSSHSHQWSAFSATDVTQSSDNLTITGMITGTGPPGTDEITIRLVNIANGHATFFFKMADGNAIATEVGGAIIESSGGNGRGRGHDDD